MARFNLPDVSFAQKSVQQIENGILDAIEQETGIRLSVADPRRKFLQAIIALIAQQRSIIDYSAKQNLLAYAEDDFLDHLGALTDTPRLQATPAKSIERFTFSITRQQTIPSGTRVTAGDNVFFATTKDITVRPPQTYVDVEIQCTVAGSVGNGYGVGQLNQLVDPLPWVQSVSNITVTSGGADAESNDPYAKRIRLAPESFSVAGPEGAYIYWAKTASPLIVDVSVVSPSPGKVEIRPLLQNGEIPDQTILDAVNAVCNDRKIRPLTDQVQVLAPQAVEYDLNVMYWIASSDSSIAASIQAKIQAAIDDYVVWQKSKLGRDIDPSELVFRIKDAGAKRVTVNSPAYVSVDTNKVAKERTVTVTYGGLEDD